MEPAAGGTDRWESGVGTINGAVEEIRDILSWVEVFTMLIAIVRLTDASAVPHMVAYLLRVY